jgi:hypothetical protein
MLPYSLTAELIVITYSSFDTDLMLHDNKLFRETFNMDALKWSSWFVHHYQENALNTGGRLLSNKERRMIALVAAGMIRARLTP